MDEFSKGHPSKSIQSLPKSIQSLLGLKAQLTPSWVESICQIINDLPKLKEAESEKDESLAKIQGDISLLNAHLNKLNIERKQALNEYLDLKGNIRVFCRIRPLLGDEIYSYERPVVTADSSNVFLKITDSKSKQYNFDKVFQPCSTQDEVFSEIEPVIKSALDGYNICIFAYGQTGTGKTYTMEGRPECPGVVPRGIEALFEQALESNYKFQFTFSMLEIYMGSLRDLLVPRSTKLRVPKPPCLSIQMDPSGGIEIENLTAVKVNDFEQVRKLYKLGSRFRSTAPTMANSTSSRSHCLIRISITSSGASGRRRETNKMWMVDLGGSERLLKTQASGRRLEEGKAINLSLSALGDVINALQSKKPHVPYRNSKLTQVLRDSLGNESDSKTLMLVHVSPKEEDMCETICSLGFATRARSIHLGSEEPKEMRAQKELAMAELLKKVKDFERERQNVKRDIERLNKRLKRLMGDEPPTEGNHDSSNPCVEQMRPNGKEKVYNFKGSTRNSANLPRFMRPTICSRRKTGTDHQISLSASRKPPIPPKTRRPSSVYAESVTYPAKSEVWQSEQGSECSISTIDHLNWNENADDGTECSQETSEYEIKKVIFPEPEKSPRSLIDSLSEETANELESGQASRPNWNNNFVIDNWLQLQMQEENNSYAQWKGRVLAVPTDTKDLSSDTKEALTDFRKELMLHTAENFDEDMVTGEPHKSMALVNTQSFTDSLSSDLKNTKHHQNNDSDQRNQRTKCIHTEPDCTSSSSDEIEIDSETSLREKGTSVSKERSTLVDSHCDDLIGSMKHNRDSAEICLASMRCRRSLFMDEVIATLDQKSAALGDSAKPIADSQEDKHEEGTNWLPGQTIRMLWGSALLGLGIHSLGFEHDFFQGLML